MCDPVLEGIKYKDVHLARQSQIVYAIACSLQLIKDIEKNNFLPQTILMICIKIMR